MNAELALPDSLRTETFGGLEYRPEEVFLSDLLTESERSEKLLVGLLVPPPLVLLQQYRPQFSEAFGGVLEHPEDCLAVGDGERDDSALRVGAGVLERICGVVEAAVAQPAG